MKKTRHRLSDRDRDILRFVHRYRIGTDDLLAQQFFGLTTGNPNVGRVVRRLAEKRFLRRVQFSGNFRYVVITRRGCRAIGKPERTARPLTEQSLPAVLAIAFFCVHGQHRRMTAAEYRELYPELWSPGQRSSAYYVFKNDAGKLMLGMFLVDRGGTAHRIKSKVKRIIRQRKSNRYFMSLIGAGRFQLTILTGLPGQQRIVERHLGGDSFEGVRVQTEVIAELGELLTLR